VMPIKLERAIFIVIFIFCLLACIFFATPIKANQLPINIGLTPEQVIETKYGDMPFKYKIYDNLMFVCINNAGNCGLNYAFKNDNSGFMFELPGFYIGSIIQQVAQYIGVTDEEPVMISVLSYKAKYYVTIADTFSEKGDIVFYKNGEKFEALSFENARNQYWVFELEDLSSFNEIEGYYKGEKIKIEDLNRIDTLNVEG
jgi:hypothetical protein